MTRVLQDQVWESVTFQIAAFFHYAVIDHHTVTVSCPASSPKEQGPPQEHHWPYNMVDCLVFV